MINLNLKWAKNANQLHLGLCDGCEEFEGSSVDYDAAKSGGCFRTESDALEWERALQEIMKN